MKWGEVTMEHCCRGSDNEGVIDRGVVQMQCGELIIKQLAMLSQPHTHPPRVKLQEQASFYLNSN